MFSESVPAEALVADESCELFSVTAFRDLVSTRVRFLTFEVSIAGSKVGFVEMGFKGNTGWETTRLGGVKPLLCSSLYFV